MHTRLSKYARGLWNEMVVNEFLAAYPQGFGNGFDGPLVSTWSRCGELICRSLGSNFLKVWYLIVKLAVEKESERNWRR